MVQSQGNLFLFSAVPSSPLNQLSSHITACRSRLGYSQHWHRTCIWLDMQFGFVTVVLCHLVACTLPLKGGVCYRGRSVSQYPAHLVYDRSRKRQHAYTLISHPSSEGTYTPSGTGSIHGFFRAGFFSFRPINFIWSFRCSLFNHLIEVIGVNIGIRLALMLTMLNDSIALTTYPTISFHFKLTFIGFTDCL